MLDKSISYNFGTTPIFKYILENLVSPKAWLEWIILIIGFVVFIFFILALWFIILTFKAEKRWVIPFDDNMINFFEKEKELKNIYLKMAKKYKKALTGNREKTSIRVNYFKTGFKLMRTIIVSFVFLVLLYVIKFLEMELKWEVVSFSILVSVLIVILVEIWKEKIESEVIKEE